MGRFGPAGEGKCLDLLARYDVLGTSHSEGMVYFSITVFMRWYRSGRVIQLSTLDRAQGWVHQHASVPRFGRGILGCCHLLVLLRVGDEARFVAFRDPTRGACPFVLGQGFGIFASSAFEGSCTLNTLGLFWNCLTGLHACLMHAVMWSAA